MNFTSWKGRALSAATLALSLGACDFITSGEGNPNAVPDATVDQLFVASQVNAFFITEDNTARIAAMWTQQASGADRQFFETDQYTLLESDADGEFSSPYTAGGLVDLRLAQQKATDAGLISYRGALKVLEAYMIGRTASLWGDIPYTEAVNPDIATPALDAQEAVYAAVQTLLDGAIADIAGAGPITDPNLDMIYGGDMAAWRRAAYSLKARYYIHWTEAQDAGGAAAAAATAACSGDCWTKAAAAAANGITSSDGDMLTFHTGAATETNAWLQFVLDRSGYVVAGRRGIDLLAERSDPRLPAFYVTTNGEPDGPYVGSAPGEGETNASTFNLASDTRMTMISCAETYYIRAEEAWHRGAEAQAEGFLRQGIDCDAAKLGVDGDDIRDDAEIAALSGAALRAEIIFQKYWANFLTAEPYNDFRRTCYPVLYEANDVDPADMPNRLLYGRTERQTNPNIPETDDQLASRNANDPTDCTDASSIAIPGDD
jgi:hypothetical protein